MRDKATQALPESASAQLARLQDQLELITNHVLEILCEVSLEGVVESIHSASEKGLGYRVGELIGRAAEEIVHPDDRERCLEALDHCLKNGRVEVELRVRHGSGSWRHLYCFGGVRRNAEGQPVSILVGGRDISQRKQTQEALEGMETRFQLVWENSREAMRLVNSEGVVVQVNDAYCRLVGKAREQLEGFPFVVAYGYDNPDTKIAEFRERFQTRILPARLDVELPLWTGEKRIFELSSSFLQLKEETLLLTIYRDITHQHQREAEMEQLNQALKHRAVQLGALTLQVTRVEQQERRRLAQIVHDHLQQILVAARMTAERLRRRIPDDELARAVAEVEELLDESIKASRSITVELSPPILHDGGLIPALEWLSRRMKEKHDLSIRLTASQDGEPEAEVMRIFLFQAVRELLFNCVKHAGVSEASVRLEAVENDQVRLVVSDSGRGFSKNAVAPGGRSLKDCFGLFSLQERISHIGGSITIQSAPGKGTEVALVVPSKPAVEELQPENTAPPVRHSGGDPVYSVPGGRGMGERGDAIRLLLVDDHKIMRQGLCELLREEPDMIVVGEAQNGLEGLKLAQQMQPDVVVMDITMPVMNGIEATRVLSKELPSIKVVGLSMHDKEDMAQAMLEAGASAYVTKAAASETLTSTIRSCLNRVPKDEGDDSRELALDIT